MFYDAIKNSHGLPVDPFKALVAPRPIAWVSTVNAAGQANLAPYSFFNAFSEDPFYVGIGSNGYKHTLSNIEATGAFAVNLVSHELAEAMSRSSAAVGADVDEFELASLAKASCEMIPVPRVAASPACLECKLHTVVPLPNDQGEVNDFLILGRVAGIHIEDRFIENGRVNTAAMKLVARLGYSEYATVTEAWRLRRP
jgi:flavin reductase (DIM6/NTAB) family NADH-FMN oxidoreductase RutF